MNDFNRSHLFSFKIGYDIIIKITDKMRLFVFMRTANNLSYERIYCKWTNCIMIYIKIKCTEDFWSKISFILDFTFFDDRIDFWS